jgi:hypothetical protein
MAGSEQRDPEQVGLGGKNVTWEEAKETQSQRDAEKRQGMLQAQQKALAHILDGYKRSGMDPVEIEERQKGWEALHRKDREELASQQQDKMDRLEIYHRGPPSERER